jgi:hypothetical protein
MSVVTRSSHEIHKITSFRQVACLSIWLLEFRSISWKLVACNSKVLVGYYSAICRLFIDAMCYLVSNKIGGCLWY